MTVLSSRGRTPKSLYPQLAQLFQDFVARTDLQLVGGRLHMVQQHISEDNSCAEETLKLLESRFTQSFSQ